MHKIEKRSTQTPVRHKVLMYAAIISAVLYLVWRTFFTLPLHFGAVSLVFGVLLLISEILSIVERLMQLDQIGKNIQPELPVIDESWYPDVDIFIATHNESTELLYKTLNACTFLEYPDKSKVHIVLCDDGNRREMAQLAASLGVRYVGMKGNKKAKAGNLNNALKQTSSPLVVTLDADMIPRSSFLMQMVPYFFLPQVKKLPDGTWVPRTKDEIDENFKIGFIQAPQSFYNPDLFQFNLFSEQRIPNEQDYFFRKANLGRNTGNAAIYAGSNTMISRAALEEIGGFVTETITEDFSTGIRIQRKGYTTYAIDVVVGNGLSPNSIKSLISQRSRWGRGCIQSLRMERLFRDPSLSLLYKTFYGLSLSYWWAFTRRMIFMLAPIAAVLFNLRVANGSLVEVLIFWAPFYILMNRAMRIVSGNIRSSHWNDVIDTIQYPYLLGPIWAETLGFSERKFIVTEKSRRSKQHSSTIYSLPHVVMLVASVACLVIGVQKSIAMGTLYNPIILFWTLINVKSLIFSVFFMSGRTNYRNAERFYVSVPVSLVLERGTVPGITTDISETGLAVKIDTPEFVPPDKPVELTLTYSKYQARMLVRVMHVTQLGKHWKYSLKIEKMDEQNRRQYMQIVYDREHTLPKELPSSKSIYDDFGLLLNKSGRQGIDASRKIPRIDMHLPFTLRTGGRGIVLDFNYLHAKIQSDFPVDYGDLLTIWFTPDVRFDLKLREQELDEDYILDLDAPEDVSVPEVGEPHIYTVENLPELLENDAFYSFLYSVLDRNPNEIQDAPTPGGVAQLQVATKKR